MQELQALGDAVGTVSKGVPQAVIDALVRSRYSMPARAAGDQSGSRKANGSCSPQTEPDKCADLPEACSQPAGLSKSSRGCGLTRAPRTRLGAPMHAWQCCRAEWHVFRAPVGYRVYHAWQTTLCECHTCDHHGKQLATRIVWMRRCAVCQMEFEDGDEVATLPCTHFYHPDCIGQWLKDRKVRAAWS